MGGSSSKAQFTHLISRLLSADVDPAEHDFWDELWKTPLSTEDIFALISPDAVRKLIKERPSNLQTLFTQAVAQLYQVVETPYPVYFDQALNCARLLSRLVPFMLEDSSNEDIRGLFWNKQVIPKSLTAEESGDAAEEETQGEYQETEPLAVILVNSLFHLLFLPGTYVCACIFACFLILLVSRLHDRRPEHRLRRGRRQHACLQISADVGTRCWVR